MTEVTLDHLTEEAVADRSEADGEPSWLRDRRLAAFKRYADQAWPDSRKDEFWRSTPFQRLAVDVPLVTAAGGTVDELPEVDLTATLADYAGLARIWDGGAIAFELHPEAEARGVILTDLASAARDHEDLVREHFGALTTQVDGGTGSDEDRTVTANDAAWTAGVFLYVPPEVELADPIGVRIHVSTPGAHLPRVLAVVGHHARAVVYLEHTSADLEEAATVDEVVEAVVADSGALDVVSLQEWSGAIGHLGLQKAALQRGASYRHLAVTVGGRTVRLRPEVDLVGEGAVCNPLGVYFADDGQHFDLQPFIRHIAPRARSDVLYKGALQGHSRTVFRGNVWVGRDAVGTDTNEVNRSLILTDGARADSTPFLEIFCSDIKASHGSATGQLDQDHLFYLQARGIPREEAVRLILYGFFEEVLAELELPGVRERVLGHIEREIESADLDALGVTQHAAPPGAEEVA